jgi:ferredoxin-NADP reductase
VGTGLTVSHPRNAFPFAADPAVLLIAGGIGITPLLPMAREAARRGLDWRLVHTGRSDATMPFAAELAALDPDAARVVRRPDDEHGGPADAAELLGHAPTPGAAVFMCGPAPMLDAVRAGLDGSPGRGLHFERFTAAPITGGRPFTLRLRRSGTTLAVPADRSALDVLRDQDPATPYSCRQGFCGVCRRTVTAGTVEHRDRRLSDQERAEGQMLVCVSRAPEGECLELDG